MNRTSSSFNLIFSLHTTPKNQFPSEQRKEQRRTFSFKWSTTTTVPRSIIAAPSTIVTQGIQSPGCRYNSLVQLLGSVLPSG